MKILNAELLQDNSPPIGNFIKQDKLNTSIMKQTFLYLILATSFLTAKSQLTKGNWLVGGTGSFFSKNGTYTTQSISYDSKYTDLTISPNIGYFILDKFSAGLKPSFSWTKSKTFPPGGGSTDITRFLVGPFTRYYFLNIESSLIYLQKAQFNLALTMLVPTKEL